MVSAVIATRKEEIIYPTIKDIAYYLGNNIIPHKSLKKSISDCLTLIDWHLEYISCPDIIEYLLQMYLVEKDTELCKSERIKLTFLV